MRIIKANGEAEEYDPEKIVRSLKRVGAGPAIIEEVLNETERELVEGTATRDLYKIVFKNLKKLTRDVAGKYQLKRAIMELGPTGYPFEKFIAELLKTDGYRTKTNQLVKGRCVMHEVDVVAESDHKRFMIECKFHGALGRVSDIKHALYVYARFLDLKKHFNEGWLVTNTRLTADAEKYGRCVGLELLSWNYPRGKGLRDLIDKKGLYPITCLTSLTQEEKQFLLQKNVVLCRTLLEQPDLIESFAKKNRVLVEAELICSERGR